jgi:cell growth-regulating nucleolar protein
MTEDQKYQGHLYREKPAKKTQASKRKSVSIVEPSDANVLVHAGHQAYVEDAHDIDSGTPQNPPHVPSPPPAVSNEPLPDVNVFDFLVTEDSPSTSKQIVPTKKSNRNHEEQRHSADYETNGFTYGAEPVPPGMRSVNGSLVSLDFMTPTAKATKAKLDKERSADREAASHSRNNSGTGSISDKKRKRAQTDTYVADTTMTDAPQTASRPSERELTHSGLTGGLNRMMSTDADYPFTHDTDQQEKWKSRQQQHEDPASPLKKSRRSRDLSEPQSRDRSDGNGLGISIKGRASKVMSMVGGGGSVLAALANPAAAHNQGTAASQALVKKTRRSSDESADRNGNGQVRSEKKRHKVHRHNGMARENVRFDSGGRSRRRDDRSRSPRRVKAIEYHSDKQRRDDSDSEDSGDGQMVVFGSAQKTAVRCESFLQYVTKGPNSEKGCSINKALKRWHRDGGVRRTEERADEEKNLWKELRLKRNERGEVVVFF